MLFRRLSEFYVTEFIEFIKLRGPFKFILMNLSFSNLVIVVIFLRYLAC